MSQGTGGPRVPTGELKKKATPCSAAIFIKQYELPWEENSVTGQRLACHWCVRFVPAEIRGPQPWTNSPALPLQMGLMSSWCPQLVLWLLTLLGSELGHV